MRSEGGSEGGGAFLTPRFPLTPTFPLTLTFPPTLTFHLPDTDTAS